MEELKKEIGKQLEILKEMINMGKSEKEINKQRKIVDELLKEYIKDL